MGTTAQPTDRTAKRPAASSMGRRRNKHDTTAKHSPDRRNMGNTTNTDAAKWRTNATTNTANGATTDAAAEQWTNASTTSLTDRRTHAADDEPAARSRATDDYTATRTNPNTAAKRLPSSRHGIPPSAADASSATAEHAVYATKHRTIPTGLPNQSEQHDATDGRGRIPNATARVPDATTAAAAGVPDGAATTTVAAVRKQKNTRGFKRDKIHKDVTISKQ